MSYVLLLLLIIFFRRIVAQCKIKETGYFVFYVWHRSMQKPESCRPVNIGTPWQFWSSVMFPRISCLEKFQCVCCRNVNNVYCSLVKCKYTLIRLILSKNVLGKGIVGSREYFNVRQSGKFLLGRGKWDVLVPLLFMRLFLYSPATGILTKADKRVNVVLFVRCLLRQELLRTRKHNLTIIVTL